MKPIQQTFKVTFQYPVHFTEDIFNPENTLLRDVLLQDESATRRKVLFVVDKGVTRKIPQIAQQIQAYWQHNQDVMDLRTEPIIVKGGEGVKNERKWVEQILEAIEEFGICRHSYLIAVGGGAVLDMAGYAAAIAHRGVRHIRIPSTVLAQNDSGIGVKNGINYFDKKNFLGAFKPPFAVINDFDFLKTLDERDWRSGISEAIKVALIKDKPFFEEIQQNASLLNARDMPAMQSLIYRCAQLHLEHIAGGDPFEMGSSRPLDFGHWSAHKLEQMTEYTIRHGEAVAVGMALDCTYSYLSGMLPESDWAAILNLLEDLGFRLYHTELSQYSVSARMFSVLLGLEEFREHLGGELTIMLLEGIGKGVEVHRIDNALLMKAVEVLKGRTI